MARILIIDDHKNMRITLGMMLRREGHSVAEAEDGLLGVKYLDQDIFDLVITDLKMEPIDGIEVIRKVKARAPNTEVMVMTAYGTIESAVKAMQLGAADYITKPFKEEELRIRITKMLEHRKLSTELQLLLSEFKEKFGIDKIIGKSPAIRHVLERVVRAAPTDSTILITGENGTGKELIAKAIHTGSERSSKPFIPVNCAAIPEQILESELFGHVKGSFTGAASSRKGLFEEADGGTFFFDEISEISPATQAKLLRTIQEQEIRRVGDNRSIQVDVRIIAATNQNLEKAIEEGRFRSDLFYRLNVIPIVLPPLRERKEDIPLLTHHFLTKFNVKMNRRIALTPEFMDQLMAFDFPGNVRELENIIEKTVALAHSDEEAIGAARLAGGSDQEETRNLDQILGETERAILKQALADSGGQTNLVARRLGLSHTTLWRKLKKHNIDKDNLK